MDESELRENFALLETWEERYAYLIELGQDLPAMDPSLKTDASKVKGCMSQVWLVGSFGEDGFRMLADADAVIVRGLVAVLRLLFEGKSPEGIQAYDPRGFFQALGLEGHLSPGRSNGLWSMIGRIKELAGNDN